MVNSEAQTPSNGGKGPIKTEHCSYVTYVWYCEEKRTEAQTEVEENGDVYIHTSVLVCTSAYIHTYVLS